MPHTQVKSKGGNEAGRSILRDPGRTNMRIAQIEDIHKYNRYGKATTTGMCHVDEQTTRTKDRMQ